MESLKIHINDKIKDDSLEFCSLTDEKKNGSFQMQNLAGFDTLGRPREKITLGRDFALKIEDCKMLHFDSVVLSSGGGRLPMINCFARACRNLTATS